MDYKDKKYEQFINYTETMINEDKLSHAFLVECKNTYQYQTIILDFVKKILNKYKYNNDLDIDLLVEKESYPELKIIKSEQNMIKKEQMLDLQRDFSVKPIYGKYLIYIIDGAEYFNNSSANTILKFLEEPSENIIAILLTGNIYNVMPTISSRCQKLLLPFSTNQDNFSEEVVTFANTLEKRQTNAFGYIDIFWYQLDKQSLMLKLKELQNFYIEKFSLKQKDKNIEQLSTLSKKIIIIDEYLKKMRYNVNIKILMDKFILEMSGVI